MKNYQPRNRARPGEVPLKNWLMDMAEKYHVSEIAIWQRVWRYKTMAVPLIRRVNRRVVFVHLPPQN